MMRECNAAEDWKIGKTKIKIGEDRSQKDQNRGRRKSERSEPRKTEIGKTRTKKEAGTRMVLEGICQRMN